MNYKLYMACAGVLSLVALGCSDSDISGSSEDPNVLTAYGSSSSVTNSSSGAFDADGGSLWNPSAGDFSVNVARYAASLPAGAKPDGRWFVETDNLDGGNSSVVWPADLVGIQNERTIVESCNGICGTVVLERYRLTYEPFAGVGFMLAKDEVGKPVPVDVSDWGGVCISYSSDAAPGLELYLGDSVNALHDFVSPVGSLPKTISTGPVTKCLKWSDFKFPSWVRDLPEGWKENVGEKAAKQLVALKFLISAMAGEYKFNITSLGTYADQISDPVSSSSDAAEDFSSSSATALSSSSVGVLSSSSTVRSSSSESCVMKTWEQLGGDYPYIRGSEICESSWPEGAIADGVWRVMETDSSCGYCNVYVDSVKQVAKGNSSVIWKAGTSKNGEAPDSTVLECGGGLCGTIILDNGTLWYNKSFIFDPFVSIGFTLARDSSGKPVPVDVSDWGGICVDYEVDCGGTCFSSPSLELDLGDSLNAMLGYANPSAKLDYDGACVKWEDFKIPSWFKGEADDWLENTGVKASKRLVGIKFKIQGPTGEYTFEIERVQAYDFQKFEVFKEPKCI